MSYKRTVFRWKNAIEVEDHCSARYGAPGMPRQKRVKTTPEQIERQNQRLKEKRCRHKLRSNFDIRDYFVTVTYAVENRPSAMAEAKKDWNRFIQKVRRSYKKAGEEIRWIRNIEVGSRGAWHIHMVLNRIPDLDVILADAWPHGTVHIQLMHQKGEFAELAAYLTKTPKTDSRLREAHYSTSRGLQVPEPEHAIHNTWQITDKIRVPKGWYLDKTTLHEGVNPITGYPYREYTLIRLQRIGPPGRKKVQSGNHRRKQTNGSHSLQRDDGGGNVRGDRPGAGEAGASDRRGLSDRQHGA